MDTAGRLHTKVNLMEELKKIKRSIGKKLPGAPHEILLVLDATAGQNGISQAKGFSDAAGCTGIVLAKLDGTAKGGVVIPIRKQFDLPVKYIGLGEKADDLALAVVDDVALGVDSSHLGQYELHRAPVEDADARLPDLRQGQDARAALAAGGLELEHGLGAVAGDAPGGAAGPQLAAPKAG